MGLTRAERVREESTVKGPQAQMRTELGDGLHSRTELEVGDITLVCQKPVVTPWFTAVCAVWV